MAATTGIILAGTVIGAGNEWYQTGAFPWRIGAAGLLLTAFMAGAEKINQPISVGLSLAFLATVLVTPFHGNSPLQEVSNVFGSGTTTKKVKRG